MNKVIIFFSGIALTTTFFFCTAYSDKDNAATLFDISAKNDYKNHNNTFQTIYAPPMPDEVNLAGEILPKDQFDAYERFDRELMGISFSHGTTMASMKLAGRYFPTIEPILAKNGIPDDFKYLAVAESNLRNATSPAGAKGLWQFMPATAREYGLEVSDEIDERYDIEKVTEAACLFLKRAYKDFGSWTLAAASYNMGGGRLREHLRTQKHTSYYDLNMNTETSRYVPRILAFKYIMQNPETYGFYLKKEELYAPLPSYKIVQVSTPIENWSDFAQAQGITYKNFKVHNPWILGDKLTNKARKTYNIKIPIGEK